VHSSQTLKKSTKILPTYTVQSAVKVNQVVGRGGPASLKEKREGEDSNGTKFFEAGFSDTHNTLF
jgi:hypothetical protein